MAEDWAIDVRKYAPDADDGVIAAIVRYCGIALRSRDASLVSFTDPEETDRVRENYCKKKLALTEPDGVIDSAIAAVGARMAGDTTRNRVTVYYLLAEHFGKLGLFGAGALPDVEPALPMMAAPLPEPLMAAPLPLAAASDSGRRGVAATGWGEYLPLLLLVLGGAALLWYLTHKKPAPVPIVAPVAVTALVAAVPAPPGADVIGSEVDGAPMVSVYFDTAKSDIDPKFEAISGPIRTYISTHPANHLQVSGFNDPRGDAAMNAELSKNRAFAVRDALAKLGVSITAITLVKPIDTSDDAGSLAQARRVDVTVEDGAAPVAEAAPAVAADAAVAKP